ncbi:MAG: DUF3048 C-terminal domain-containing protein [Clostridia bacterium]|nr:DUF3048 C-terminal domain-containing protein [Clostridia bacterium]
MKSSRTKAERCVTVILSALLVVASLSIAGCSLRFLSPDKTPSDENSTVVQPGNTDENNANNEKPQEDKPTLPSYYNPLTGLASATDLSMIRPVSVCLSSTSSPQYGVADAEILVEAPVENGATRNIMITTAYREMNRIGSIGTTRPYLLSIASDFGAVSVCKSANDVRDGVSYPEFPCMNYEIDGATTVFFKSGEEGAAEELYTSGTRLIGALENFEKGGVTLPFTFVEYGKTVTASDKRATGVIIPFSSTDVTQFLYNAEDKVYLRSHNSAPHLDNTSGKQVSFTNLILLHCESSIYNRVSGTEFELNTESGGTGYYVTNGYATEIAWSRDAEGKLQLSDESGAALTVNRGKTYIGLIDLVNSSSVLIVE